VTVIYSSLPYKTMWYHLLADLILLVHIAFVAFVLLGGLFALKWRPVMWMHLPAAVWGAIVELSGWICPLTPLENWLREQAGETGYRGDFIAHYLVSILYPGSLTREVQTILGLVVILVNAAIYWWLWQKRIFPPSLNH
jgi:Protein of Unknown function (DUF2784)